MKRLEYTRYETEQLVTHHCIDCGAHVAVTFAGQALPHPTAVGPFSGAGNRRTLDDVRWETPNA